MTAARSCKVSTFYSYKGGTGRTMALANVAWILAATGKRVLTIDWDLEAPGLHRYLAPFLSDPECTQTEGLLDWVYEYLVAVTEPGPELPANWADAYAEISGFASSTNWQFPGEGCLHFISAGRQDAGYAERVNKLDWFRLYTEHGGKAFLESAFRQAREHYDHILVDSRTGVADTSGICTVQLPDQLVALFTLNNQSINGCSEVAKHAQAARKAEGRELQVLPVATRVELAEDDRLKKRQRLARARCEQFVPVREQSRYFADLQLPYVPYYAYEEVLATVREQPDGGHPLLRGFLALASKVAGQEISRLPEISARKREAALASYAKTSVLGTSDAEDAEAVATAASVSKEEAWDVFISYPLNLGSQAEALHRHLTSRANVFLASRSVPAGANVDELVAKAREQAKAHVFLIGSNSPIAGGWYSQELDSSLARRARTGAPLIIPVPVDGARTDSAAYQRLAAFQKVSLNSGGERQAAQLILSAMGFSTADAADDARDRAVAAETRLEELSVKSRRNQAWLIGAMAASAVFAAVGILQHRQSAADAASLLAAQTAQQQEQQQLRKAKADLLTTQQELDLKDLRGRVGALSEQVGRISRSVEGLADKVQAKSSEATPSGVKTGCDDEFTDVISQLDGASRGAQDQLSSALALDAEIGAAMLTDDELADTVTAQRARLDKVQQEIAKLAQDIAAKRTSAKDPASASKLWVEGFALAAKGNADAAKKKYDEALKLNPKYAPAINSLGVLHYNAGRFQAADEQFQRAIKANAAYVPSYTNHALAMLQLGQPNEAKAAAEDALKRRPEDESALRILSKLNANAQPTQTDPKGQLKKSAK